MSTNEEFMDIGFDDRCINDELSEEETAFLMERFNVRDVDALSDKEFEDLRMLIGTGIACDEIVKAEKNTTPGEYPTLSEVGTIANNVVAYMSDQYLEGGKRFKG